MSDLASRSVKDDIMDNYERRIASLTAERDGLIADVVTEVGLREIVEAERDRLRGLLFRAIEGNPSAELRAEIKAALGHEQ